MHRFTSRLAAGAFAICLVARAAYGDVFNMSGGNTSLQLVPVGNAGNANDSVTSLGGVSYNYNVSKFEITVGQYCEFLNAVAKTDTYDLYNVTGGGMNSDANTKGIARTGSSGSFVYTVVGSANHPIAFPKWGSAARFCNWLTNGQPTGAQVAGTTEDGSYSLNGETTQTGLYNIQRNTTGGRYFIPSQSEWIKAAYYDPTKSGNPYWVYPTRNDTVGYSDQPPGTDSPNAQFAANFKKDDSVANNYDDGYAVTGSPTLGSANMLTDVGAYISASSYYGTFDQGGNLFEWTEGQGNASQRIVRGASWLDSESFLRKTNSFVAAPNLGGNFIGFRITEVFPEPVTALPMVWLTVALLRPRPLRRANRASGVMIAVADRAPASPPAA
jgi:formylglycine-generating enzyme required for sulfatase activity